MGDVASRSRVGDDNSGECRRDGVHRVLSPCGIYEGGAEGRKDGRQRCRSLVSMSMSAIVIMMVMLLLLQEVSFPMLMLTRAVSSNDISTARSNRISPQSFFQIPQNLLAVLPGSARDDRLRTRTGEGRSPIVAPPLVPYQRPLSPPVSSHKRHAMEVIRVSRPLCLGDATNSFTINHHHMGLRPTLLLRHACQRAVTLASGTSAAQMLCHDRSVYLNGVVLLFPRTAVSASFAS